MNAQIQRVLQNTLRFVVLGLVLYGISSSEILAQKPVKAAPKAKEVWYISYEVTIKGSGSTNDHNGAGDEANWEVDRSYSGTVELGYASPLVNQNMSQRDMIASLRSGSIMSWRPFQTATLDGMTLPIKIKINDKIHTHSEHEGEGRSFENYTNTTHWEGTSTATKTQNAMELLIDKTRSTYNVTIPLKLVTSDPWLSVKSTTLVKRSKYGWGDKPESETITGSQMVGFDTVKIPEIKGLLEDGMIHHPAPYPLKIKDGAYEYDSGVLAVEEPLFGARDTYAGVMIRVYYLFKKMPAN